MEIGRVREPRRTSLPWLVVSGFKVMGWFPGCLANLLPVVRFRTVLVAHASLSQDGFQGEGLWEIGHLLPLSAPPEFSQLVFGRSTMGPPL